MSTLWQRPTHINFEKEGSGLATASCQKADFFQEHCDTGKQTLMTLHGFPQTDRLWEGLSEGMCWLLPVSHLQGCLPCMQQWADGASCLDVLGSRFPCRQACYLPGTNPSLSPGASGPLLLAINEHCGSCSSWRLLPSALCSAEGQIDTNGARSSGTHEGYSNFTNSQVDTYA